MTLRLSNDADGPRSLRSPREIAAMREAGLVVWRAHQAAAQLVKPGAKTIDIDRAVEEVFEEAEALPLFKNFPGPVPFPAVTCISVNEEVVHGIPRRSRSSKRGTYSASTRVAK